MKTITEMLLEERSRSAEFSKLHYGLHLGDDFPSMARELLESSAIAQQLLGVYIIDQLTSSSVIKSLSSYKSADVRELLRNNPEISRGRWSSFIGA